jgi:hypothetical protein
MAQPVGVKNILSNEEHMEGKFTQAIESQTAKLPSVGYLGLAVGSMIASAAIAVMSERKEFANFVGLWAPSFLLMGIYNKLVKLQGSDSHNKMGAEMGSESRSAV